MFDGGSNKAGGSSDEDIKIGGRNLDLGVEVMELGEERVGVKDIGVWSFFMAEMFVPKMDKKVV